MEKKEFVCKFCNKRFPSGKSLGGHIRIHSPKMFSVDSDSFIGKNKKRLVDQREITPLKQQQQQQCRVKALANHMDCHEGEEKIVMDTQSASETTTTTTSSGPTMNKRSKKQHSNSESFSAVSYSSSDYGIAQGAKDLMFYHLGREGYNLAVNSMVDDSSENNSEILETKSSSGELLKKTDKAAAADDDDSDDNGSSDSDYFLNGPKKSDSDISVGGSLRNTGFGFKSIKSGDELRNKEGGSKHELGKSKRFSPFYESDSSADTNSKIRRFSDSKPPMVKRASGANKNSRGHECPICFKVYSSGQALGGHKRSHTTIANQEQRRIKHKAADTQFDLNLPGQDDDDDDE